MEKKLSTSWKATLEAVQNFLDQQLALQADADKAWADLSGEILQEGSALLNASLSSEGDLDALEELSAWAEQTQGQIAFLLAAADSDPDLNAIQKENIQNHAEELQESLNELQNIWANNF